MDESQSAEDSVARFGERILTELSAGRTNDTLTRWLAHHTAALVDAADRAAEAGAPDADARGMEARTAIEQLWEHRSSWPEGWPPPRAAEVVRLLNELPAPGEQQWQFGTVLDRLQRLHHQILATMVDLATVGKASIEEGWLAQFGDHLTTDEVTLLTRAAETDNRLEQLMRWTQGLEDYSDGDELEEALPPSLANLADTYRQTVLDCLQRARSVEVLESEGGEQVAADES